MKLSPIFYALASVLIFASIAGANQIGEIFIEKGVYNAPDMSQVYEIYIDISGDNIHSVSFSCAGSGSGDLTYHLDDDDWCFEDESDLSDFFSTYYPNGDFEFSVTFKDFEVRDYTVAFNNPIPWQIPVITYPAHMQVNVEKEPTFMWNAVVDSDVNAIWQWLDNPVTDEEIWDMLTFDTTIVSLDSPTYLPDGWLIFGLDFVNVNDFTICDLVTTDEISVTTMVCSSSGVEFSTVPVPEPATIAMITAGALGMAGIVRKRLA